MNFPFHFAGLGALFAIALAPAQAANATPPTWKGLTDLTYKTVEAQPPLTLDLYLPATAPTATPLIVLIHGGGWNAGRKEDYRGVAQDFASHGYAAATVEYRFAKVAPFPAQIEDVKAALRWLRAHAAEYHFDPDHVAAMGHSAGGHLASLVGTSAHVKAFDTGENLNYPANVQAVIDLAGPEDLTIYFAPNKPSARVLLLGGTLDEKRDLAKLASPVTHLGADTPPFLIMSGMQDPAVPLEQPKLLYAALQKAGVPCQLMIVPGLGHGIPLQLPYGGGRLFDAIYYFLDPILCGGRNAASWTKELPPTPPSPPQPKK